MKSFEQYIDFPRYPEALEGSVVLFEHVRLTVLTSRLIRIEYSTKDEFRDVATQTVLFRNLPTPTYEVERTEGSLRVTTEHLVFQYIKHPRGFTRDSLTVMVKETGKKWIYGTSSSNLKGTCRTLDKTDGPTELEDGLVSRDGFAVIDDTNSFTFDDNSWFKETYFPAGEYEDLYFFGHGHDYKGALKDFIAISGKVPMLPRWSLGNWWSRYWHYDANELIGLMDQFKEEEIPLSICIVDMDWHITDVKGGGSSGWSAGWTGYTWNKDLFPDPQGFLNELHDRGLKTSLNLHPADGLLPHEDMYEEMANFMGVDPEKGDQIPFDIVDKKFAQGYFEIMHHPHEEQGVDFWWTDWQQGSKIKSSHLDPLFLLNHLHFADGAKDEGHRPFVFSRYGGLGNQRYPIGFSGDSASTWDTLRFQPYLTATAANVGYGWWSHDIGGHHYGVPDGELYARWVQFGVFSPIMRLHSTKRVYENRHPWRYDRDVLDVTRNYMQLRHQMIPYLYTMSYLNYKEDVPFMLPLYYEHPEADEAYRHGGEYYFGEQLIVSPYLDPKDDVMGFAHQNLWLPEGQWYDFFKGEYYSGDKHYPLYGTLEDVPVFAKAGSIVPLGEKVMWGGVDRPDNMELHVFPGANGEFTLYEDDGETQAYLKNGGATTRFTQEYKGEDSVVTLHPIEGEAIYVPEGRQYKLILKGFTQPKKIVLTVNGENKNLAFEYDHMTGQTTVEAVAGPRDQGVEIKIVGKDQLAIMDRNIEKNLQRFIHESLLSTNIKDSLLHHKEEVMKNPKVLLDYDKYNEVTVEILLAVMEIVYDKPYFIMK